MREGDYILTINGGSSSIKFSLYKIEETLKNVFSGQVEDIGDKKAKLSFKNSTTQNKMISIGAADHSEAAHNLIDWLKKQEGFDSVKAVGHRIVHGLRHTKPEVITPALIKELKMISAYDPDHLPEEIRLIELFGKLYPSVRQIACFDTSFHTSLPAVAKMLSIPRSYYNRGIQRYGFHGLSYSYLMEELEKLAGRDVANGKIILAHLGSGASLAAVRDGKCIDTSMAFTPASGLMMGTRSGDLDPGVAWYLMNNDKLSPKEFSHMINQESGLLGVSESTSDMQDLMEKEDTDTRAAEAIELFCYQAKKWIGSFAAALSGLDTLVFSGGIGEHAPEVRNKICDGLDFLGIRLDEVRNMRNEKVISAEKCKVSVWAIPTNEELMIARLVCDVSNHDISF